MSDEQDEEALFDRLAKALGGIRQSTGPAGSGGAEGSPAGSPRTEAELRSLAAGMEALRQGFERQDAATLQLQAAAAKNEADLQALRQAVEALSRRMREQLEMPARSSTGRPPPRAVALIGIALAVLVLGGGGTAAWIASGREPTIGALAHRFVVRLSEVTGIDLTGPGDPGPSVRAVAQATSIPESPPQPQAPVAPTVSAAPVLATLPPGATVGPPTPSIAPPSPAQPPTAAAPPPVKIAVVAPPLAEALAAAASPPTPIAAMAPPLAAGPAAAVPPQVQTPADAAPPPAGAPAAVASPPAQMAAVIPLLPATPTPAAAPPIAPSAAQASAAASLAEFSHPPPAVGHVVLRATADAWVRVRQNGGEVLLTRTLKAGDTWPVPAEPDLLLDVGNVDGLKVEVDGVPTRLTAPKGGVIHDLPLDADLLVSGAAMRLAH